MTNRTTHTSLSINGLSTSLTYCLLFILCISYSANASEYDPSASVFRFQQKMAERGDAESQFKLGLMYETGSGVEQSLVSSIIWYRKAADQNHKAANNRLTYLEIKKNGFKESHNQWLIKLKNDARFNEGEALFLLGQMYAEGTGVNKSLTRSLKLLRKAAGGNIPGSEAEILRVEAELGKLQEEYLTDEDAVKLAPIAILPKKTPTIKPTVKSAPVRPISTTKRKKNTDNTESLTNRQLKEKAQQKQRLIQAQQEALKKQTTSPTLTTKTTSAATRTAEKKVLKTSAPEPVQINNNQPETAEEKTAEHPMDTICGGMNRFQRGCR